jgi:exodeoxyribonuclease VII small subunit
MARSKPDDPADHDASAPAAPAASKMKYEAALSELEQIVQRMEGGQLPLEESLAAYRRGSDLLKHCQRQLSDAERKIQVLEEGALNDFDSRSGDTQ